MDAIGAVKAAAQATGTPTTHIGPAMGRASRYVASAAARGSDPLTGTTAAMLDACGYVLAAVPVSQPLPPGSLVIDPRPTA